MLRQFCEWFVLAAVFLPAAARAQESLAGRVVKDSFAPRPQSLRPVLDIGTFSGEEVPAGSGRVSLKIDAVRFEGDPCPIPEAAERLRAELTAGTLTVSDLYARVHAMEREFAGSGYVLTRVTVPPQRIAPGDPVIVKIVHGRIEQIDVTGDTFGGLDSGNRAVWNTTYASSGGSVAQSGNRYVFAYQPTLTFTSTDLSKTYGTDNGSALPGAYTVSGYQNAVSGAFLGDTAALTWSGTPALTSLGSSAGASVGGGPYQIAISAGSVSSLDNYALAFSSAGSLAVNRAPLQLTYTANGAASIYGSPLAVLSGTVSGTGFVNGEGLGSLSGTAAWTTTASSGSNVGSYAIGGAGLSSGNYTITTMQAAGNGTAYTITPAALTITANDAAKTYDSHAWSGGNGVGYAGFVNGDTATSLSGTLAYGGAAQGAVNAGSYGLTASGLSNSNYAITYAPGTLTIGRAALTVTGNTTATTYNAAAQGNGFTVAGLLGGDSVTGVAGLASGTNAGSYADSLSGATGSGLSNYAVGYVNGGLTIGRAALTVTANDALKAFDGQPWAGGTGVTYRGFQGGDTAASLTGALVFGGSAQGAVAPGLYAISPAGLASGNYNIAFQDGALRIGSSAAPVVAHFPSTIRINDPLRFHLRAFEHDIAQTKIEAEWLRSSCRTDPSDWLSVQISNTLAFRKEHIYASAICADQLDPTN